MNKQQVITTINQNYYGSSKHRPYGLATVWTALGDIGVHVHRRSTYTTVLCIAVPIKQLVAFASFEIQLLRQFVERLAQTAHLEIAFVDRLVYTKSLNFCAVVHRRHVKNVSVCFNRQRCIVALRNGIGAVIKLLQHYVATIENKPICHNIKDVTCWLCVFI